MLMKRQNAYTHTPLRDTLVVPEFVFLAIYTVIEEQVSDIHESQITHIAQPFHVTVHTVTGRKNPGSFNFNFN